MLQRQEHIPIDNITFIEKKEVNWDREKVGEGHLEVV